MVVMIEKQRLHNLLVRFQSNLIHLQPHRKVRKLWKRQVIVKSSYLSARAMPI